MVGVAVSYTILCAFVLLTGASAVCPQEAQVSEMCIPSVRTGSRVLIDMSTATEEIQNCKCTFTTTANTVKFMTYSTPGYPNCGSVIDITTDSGTNTTFECLMSGSFLDTTDNKNGSITLEQIAAPFDKNYCLILEHAGELWDSVTVTCTNTALKTDGVSATPTSPAITNAALSAAEDRLSTITPIFSAPDPPSNRKMAILIDEQVPLSDKTLNLNTVNETDMIMQSALTKSKPTPTEKVTGAILFQGNVNDSKQKQYQSINLINTTGRNVSSNTLNTVQDNTSDIIPKEQSIAADTSDFIAETNQTGVKTEPASVVSMSPPSLKISFNAESIKTNVNSITELSSINYMTGANISDIPFTGNDILTVKEPIPELTVKEDIVKPKEPLQNSAGAFSTTRGLSDVLTSLSANDKLGSSGILFMTDKSEIQEKNTSRVNGSDSLIDQNKTDIETVLDNSQILSVPIVSMTDKSNVPLLNLSMDSIPFASGKENHSQVQEVSHQMAAFDSPKMSQEISPSRIESGTVVFSKNEPSYVPSAVDVRTIRFDEKQPEESTRTALAPESIMSRITDNFSVTTNGSILSSAAGSSAASAKVYETTTGHLGPTPDHELNKKTSQITVTVNTVAETPSFKMTTSSVAEVDDSTLLDTTLEALTAELNVKQSATEQTNVTENSDISSVSTNTMATQSALIIPTDRNTALATNSSAEEEPAASSHVDLQTPSDMFASSTTKSAAAFVLSTNKPETPFVSLAHIPMTSFASSTSEPLTPFISSTKKHMAPFVSSTYKAVQNPSVMESTESSIIESADAISLAESESKSPKLESSSQATSTTSLANLSEMTVTETAITPIDEQIFFKIVELLHTLSQKREVKDLSVSELPENQSFTSAPKTAEVSAEPTEQISSLIERPLETEIITQIVKDNATDQNDTFQSEPAQINETITKKIPTLIQTTKKAYSVVVDSVQDKDSKTEVKGNRVNKSRAKEEDDPSLFGIDRTILIIILACVGGAVLILIIMALVVNRRRKKRTASAPITNHKFTVDNIIYDNGCAGEDPEKGISSPIDTSNIEENVQQPSTSNGIEVRTH